jgi:hypothetical protein
MSKVDWDKAPDGTERYREQGIRPWLRKVDGRVEYYDTDTERWVIYLHNHVGIEHWRDATKRPKPTPTPTPTDVDSTITQRGERYGKFKDGSVIMQDLKNIMRETPNWEGLTPSQREALEMIQHKIGRILNGDPMYDDNWRDICGYSQLVLDELNGAVR